MTQGDADEADACLYERAGQDHRKSEWNQEGRYQGSGIDDSQADVESAPEDIDQRGGKESRTIGQQPGQGETPPAQLFQSGPEQDKQADHQLAGDQMRMATSYPARWSTGYTKGEL